MNTPELGHPVAAHELRWPQRTPLAGARVTLEPLDPDSMAEELYAAGHADETALALWTYLPDGPFPDVATFRTWLYRQHGHDHSAVAFRDHETGALFGTARYMDILPAFGSMEIGAIWFAPPLQRSPQTTEALFLMIRHAFDDLGYRRMQWRCNALNQRSRAAALRLGFTFEGVFRQHMIVKGRNRDTAWFSILDGEWPALRSNFETWLAPENFSEDGQQRCRLVDLHARSRGEQAS
ncbi:MAG: GNAT family protein [Pseudomonadota bacterium]